MMKKKWLSAPALAVIFLFLAGIVLAATSSGLFPQFFGHTQDEIKLIEEKLNPPRCSGTSCSVQCSPGYMIFSGSCNSTSALPHWNLFGARSDHKWWDCVDGAGDSSTFVTVKATCVKTYFDSSYTPVCGNYIVDPATIPPEVCDGPNVLGYDCEDFRTQQGTQLCNGTMGACSSACSGIDISKCEYCDPGVGTCTIPGQILCADGSCDFVCGPGTGGGVPSGTTLGSTPTPPGGWYYPPGAPLVPPPVGSPYCGDGTVNQPSEECDGDPVDCGDPVCVVTDPTEPPVCYPWECHTDCTCWVLLP